MQARTQFPPEPRSAAAARHWVRDQLSGIGRNDLVPSAEAGVSELVTNGILHAKTSIGLQVSGNHSRVIIEVYDGSPMSQQANIGAAATTGGESTIGRGLRIVRAHAREWGVSTTNHGKAIWFQPTPTNGTGGHAAGTAPAASEASAAAASEADDAETDDLPFDLDSALDALAEAFPDTDPAPPAGRADDDSTADDTVHVRLLDVSPWLVHHYRNRWLELVREMHLVAMADACPGQQMARRFCAAARAVDDDLYLFDTSTAGCSPSASDDGVAVDGVIDVRRSQRAALVEIRDLARELERDWAGIRLLFVHPGPQAAQLREWWLGELIGQIDGVEPTSWPGERRVRDEAFAVPGSNSRP